MGQRSRVDAIKFYFGNERPVSNEEIMALRAKDADGNTYLQLLGDGALAALGDTLLEKPA